MKRNQLEHIPVMRDAVLAALELKPQGRYLDATFGRGGHAAGMLSALDDGGRLLVMDRDPEAIAEARRLYADDSRVSIRHGNFADLNDWSEVREGLDGALFDLGVSSPQLDRAERGFSFQADAPLDMRMDTTQGESAADFLEAADVRAIADVLWRYGEERMSRRIARAIVARREQQPIRRTGELADLIAAVVGRREKGKHPATRSFQALRIHVNGELDAVQQGLVAVLDCLKPGARLAVISFHSLEDRLVKRFMRDQSGHVVADRRLPPAAAKPVRLRTIGKARFADAAELADNPRARSAVLRVAEVPT
ncbi:MAG: 16S rRNA (cytosine(1402)-N(4))-methyltransferase RsmH [Rhodanobacteraceae bacterium]